MMESKYSAYIWAINKDEEIERQSYKLPGYSEKGYWLEPQNNSLGYAPHPRRAIVFCKNCNKKIEIKVSWVRACDDDSAHVRPINSNDSYKELCALEAYSDDVLPEEIKISCESCYREKHGAWYFEEWNEERDYLKCYKEATKCDQNNKNTMT